MYPTLIKTFFYLLLVTVSGFQLKHIQPYISEESTSYSFKMNPIFDAPSEVENRRLSNFQSYQLNSPKTFWANTRPDAVELNRPPNFLESLLQQLRPSQSIRPLLKTRVVVVTVSSTIVTPRIAACIPSLLFANQSPTSCLSPQWRSDFIESIAPTLVLR